MTRLRVAAAIAVALLLILASASRAFVLNAARWPPGAITMHAQLGSSGGTLADGSADWGASYRNSLAVWNGVIGDSQFSIVPNSTAPIAASNSVNNVLFSDNVFGTPFGGSTLAVTRILTQGLARADETVVETDMIFNTAFRWNSYAGTLDPGGVIDFNRVAIHENGHVLGLNHPDERGQTVPAIMNANVSNIFTLQLDDIAGGISYYGGQGIFAPVSFPPRDQTLNFRRELENIYRDVLGRGFTQSFVDIEGSVIWISEDVRFLLTGCSGDSATARTIYQIAGFGNAAPCGPLPFVGTVIGFPPRDVTFAFRRELEAVYRDNLGRSAVQTRVDPEGDVVWTQEFLRFVMQGCSSAEATSRVRQEIATGANLPGCR